VLGDVAKKIDAWVKEPGNLDGVALKANGDSQFFAETMASMGMAIGTSFMLVYVLLVVLYGSFLTPFVVLVGLFNSRRRLLHDIVLGTVVINNSVRSPVGQPARTF